MPRPDSGDASTRGTKDALDLTGSHLSIEDVVSVARGRTRVTPLAPTEQIMQSRQWVDKAVKGEITDPEGNPLPVYGVNTPFGSLAFKNVFKTPQEGERLSRNLITSHSAGVGHYFSEDVVRAAMLIRANTLAKGLSGIRPEVINCLIKALNADIYPAVPEKGSLGASGDLAPLSHLALVISRPPFDPDRPDGNEESGHVLVPFEAQVHHPSECVVVEGAPQHDGAWVRADAKAAMEDARIPRQVLQAKEGLALNNGATFSAALAALAVHDALLLIKNAEIALAMTVEAVQGYRDAFLPQVHKARRHRGQMDCAANALRLIESSSLVHGDQDVNPENPPPQDAYSIRCAPQVMGAVRDVLAWVRDVVETELNAATDNPLIFASEDPADENYLPRTCKAISCGNFHGEPLAFAMDFLKIAVAELGNIVERRIFRMLTETLNRNLDPMLVHTPEAESGMRNGYMIAQYTAAALVSDNKTLAHPDSVDSIPTCEDQEDHVSMAPNAGRRAREVIWNVQQIVGIEMLCAAQALDFRLEGKEYVQCCEDGRVKHRWRQVHTDVTLGQGTRVAYAYIRDPERGAVPHWDQDRIMYPELARAAAMVRSGEIVRAVEASLGSALR